MVTAAVITTAVTTTTVTTTAVTTAAVVHCEEESADGLALPREFRGGNVESQIPVDCLENFGTTSRIVKVLAGILLHRAGPSVSQNLSVRRGEADGD